MLSSPDDGKECVWHYDAEVFDTIAIHRMQEQFGALLNGIADGEERPVAELSILPDRERHKVLIEWCDTKADYPQDICLHELFEAQVQRTPEAVALTCEGFSLTYRELSQRANQLAHALRECGVGPDVIVGVHMERSLEMVVAILGVLKSGGAYVPLDPAYPAERLAFMLEDTKAPVVLSQSTIAANLTYHRATIICLDSDGPAVAAHSTVNPVSTTTPDNLAYVIYTSGSTGTPKGVMVQHRGQCNLVVTQMKLCRRTGKPRRAVCIHQLRCLRVGNRYGALSGATLCVSAAAEETCLWAKLCTGHRSPRDHPFDVCSHGSARQPAGGSGSYSIATLIVAGERASPRR